MALCAVYQTNQFFDNNGNPLAGGKLYTRQGGTSTPQSAYTDSTGNVSLNNPITLDAYGRVASGIWLQVGLTYKLILTDSLGIISGVTYWTIDNVNAAGGSVTPVSNGGTGATTLTGAVQGNGTSALTAGTLPVNIGGTGATTLTGVLSGNGTGAITGGTTVAVNQGGTGVTTNTTAYSVLCAGTTATGAIQSTAGVGTFGQTLTSNGASSLPTMQTNGMVQLYKVIQTSGSTNVITILAANAAISGKKFAHYKIIFTDFATITTAARNFTITFSTDNTPTYFTAGSQFRSRDLVKAGTSVITSSSTDAAPILYTSGAVNPSTQIWSGEISFNCLPGITGNNITVSGTYHFGGMFDGAPGHVTGSFQVPIGAGSMGDYIKLTNATDTVQGTVTLYGIPF